MRLPPDRGQIAAEAGDETSHGVGRGQVLGLPAPGTGGPPQVRRGQLAVVVDLHHKSPGQTNRERQNEQTLSLIHI